MQDKMQQYRQEVIHLRKQLAEIEHRRVQSGQAVPSEVWQQLVEISHRLVQAEAVVARLNQETKGEINQLRDQIITVLGQYNHWWEQMRAMEQLFLVNIVHPGYYLKQAIRQREYLEQQYRRMQRGIEGQTYPSLEALEADIRKVLVHGQEAFEADERGFVDEQLLEKRAWQWPLKFTLDGVVDAAEQDRLISEFKRVVLPAVHPDTSDTPEEIFKTVFETYERQDYLLMEAYIVEYRGEIGLDSEQDPLESQEQLAQYQRQYHRLSGRLERRVADLQKELAPEELADPQKVETELYQQRLELHQRIQQETEQIFTLRERIEGMVQVYLRHKPGGQDEQ